MTKRTATIAARRISHPPGRPQQGRPVSPAARRGPSGEGMGRASEHPAGPETLSISHAGPEPLVAKLPALSEARTSGTSGQSHLAQVRVLPDTQPRVGS